MTIGQLLPTDKSILAVVLYYNRKTGILEKVTSGYAGDGEFRELCHFKKPFHYVADTAVYVFFVYGED